MPILSDRYLFKNPAKRLAAGLFDFAGALLFFLFRPRRPLDASKIKKILLIRTDQLGDAVMIRPAALAFKKQFPAVQIDLLCDAASLPLFQEDLFLTRLIGMSPTWFSGRGRGGNVRVEFWRILREVRAERYDAAIDFRGDLRSILLMTLAGIPERVGYGVTGGGFLLTRRGQYSRTLHQVLLNARLLDFFKVDGAACKLPPLSVTQKEAQSFWQGNGRPLAESADKRLIFHFGAGRPEKSWKADRCQALLKKVSDERLGKIVLIGAAHEKKLLPAEELPEGALDLRGKTTLRELIVLLSKAAVFTGMDSGPAHVAACQGLPVVSIFGGPNDPALWHPWAERLFLVAPAEAESAEVVLNALKKALQA